jgi:hypothetical protein
LFFSEDISPCSSGAYRFSDVMASARQDTMKIIQEMQTNIQPDDGCCIQFSSVRFGPFSDTNFILSVKFHVAFPLILLQMTFVICSLLHRSSYIRDLIALPWGANVFYPWPRMELLCMPVELRSQFHCRVLPFWIGHFLDVHGCSVCFPFHAF